MKLQDVQQGQEFILLRNGKRFTHHGIHPERKYWALTAPYSKDPQKRKSLHIGCEVDLLSDNHTVDHKKPLFLIESGEYFRVREWREAESEHQLYQDMQKNEPWRFPLTITEVRGD